MIESESQPIEGLIGACIWESAACHGLVAAKERLTVEEGEVGGVRRLSIFVLEYQSRFARGPCV